MRSFVLVHGAWHDSSCWDLLEERLVERGHGAIGVDLPAGDAEAGIDEYAAVVTDAIDLADDPEEVVVVAHSFGGLILPVVADRRPVSEVVYLAAFVAQPGRSFNQQVKAEPDMFSPAWRELARRQVTETDGSTRWPPDAAIEAFYHDCDPSTAERAASRLRAQHWLVAEQTCPLDALPRVQTRYLACRNDRSVNAAWAVRTARERLGVEAEVLETSHSPMLANPDLLAQMLVGS